MFENPETTPQGAPVAATPAPAPSVPATDAPPSTPSVDVASVEQSLKQFGSDWSLANLPDKLSEYRKGYGKQGQELDTLKRKMRDMEEKYLPLERTMNEVPGFREGFQNYTQQFFQQQMQEPTMAGYAPQYAPAFQDPVAQRVSQLENQYRISQLSNDLNSIQSAGLPLDQDMADAVLARAQSPGYEHLSGRELYFAMYGERALAAREEAAAKATAEAIQKNNESYTPGPARGTAPPASVERPDFRGMSYEQFNAWAVKNNERILAGFNK